MAERDYTDYKFFSDRITAGDIITGSKETITTEEKVQIIEVDGAMRRVSTASRSRKPLYSCAVLYPFTSTEHEEYIAIMPGDMISVTAEIVGGEWLKGINETTGELGVFPKSYVRQIGGRNEEYMPKKDVGFMGGVPSAPKSLAGGSRR